VKLVFAEMRRQGWTYDDLEWKSGVLRPTLKAWRHKNSPNLQNIEAVLAVLGYDFVPIPRANTLPKELVSELQPISEKLKLSLDQTVKALIEIVAGVHNRLEGLPKTTRERATPDRPRRVAKKVWRDFVHPDQPYLFYPIQ
jgi:transcriptional regulator with XRE-family HTH domain